MKHVSFAAILILVGPVAMGRVAKSQSEADQTLSDAHYVRSQACGACHAEIYARSLCPLLTSAPFAYPSGAKVDGWEGTTTCAKPNPLPSDIARWTADSIVTAGATYNFPQTAMSWFYCVTPGTVNQSTGQASFLIDQVVPLNGLDVNCYSGGCKGEGVWGDPTAFDATVTDMLTQCMPNH